jgi:glyoxylase I family protein
VHIHHLALRTQDVSRLEAFYRDVVGLSRAPDERPAGARSVWLTASRTRVMIEPREPEEEAIPRGSMDLVAFAIDPAERARFEARLERAAVTIEQRTDFTLYFRDPDGRRLAVSHYPDRVEPT